MPNLAHYSLWLILGSSIMQLMNREYWPPHILSETQSISIAPFILNGCLLSLIDQYWTNTVFDDALAYGSICCRTVKGDHFKQFLFFNNHKFISILMKYYYYLLLEWNNFVRCIKHLIRHGTLTMCDISLWIIHHKSWE